MELYSRSKSENLKLFFNYSLGSVVRFRTIFTESRLMDGTILYAAFVERLEHPLNKSTDHIKTDIRTIPRIP